MRLYLIIFHSGVVANHTCLQADDELDNPYLKGFAWDEGESYFEVHLQSQPATGMSSGGGGGKKKKKNKDADE